MFTSKRTWTYGFVLLVTLFALLFLAIGWNYPYWAAFGPGPGFFPVWIAGGLILCIPFLVANAYRTEREQIVEGQGVRQLAKAVILMTLAILPIFHIGMIPTLALLLFTFFYFVDRHSFWTCVLMAATVAISIYLIFGVWLGVQFPEMFF
jgi:uncharacterized membrane protein